MTLAEPAVTLTDYGLAVECALFVILLLAKQPAHTGLQASYVVFFTALGAAAFTGGTVHGFFYDKTSAAHLFLWNATLIAIGIVALSAWRIGAGLIRNRTAGARVFAMATVLFVVYCLIIVFVQSSFVVAIFHYLPAVVFLFVVYLLRYMRDRGRCFLVGLIGLGFTFVAAGIQQSGIALHPRYFDHNALYHLVQAVALLLLYLSAREIVQKEA